MKRERAYDKVGGYAYESAKELNFVYGQYPRIGNERHGHALDDCNPKRIYPPLDSEEQTRHDYVSPQQKSAIYTFV